MTSKKIHTWKEVGWDGFRVTVPFSWEADRIGKNYLLLENRGKPALEAKWNFVKGKFAPAAYLKKLKKAMPGWRNVRPWAVPRTWWDAIDPLEYSGFQWQGELFSGKGLMLFCGECGRTTLLQFYERAQEKARELSPQDRLKILSSFKDHAVEGKILWSLFDIRLCLPRRFSLRHHSFAPGAFEIGFDAVTCQVSFHRWSPASIILSKNNLDAFARSAFSIKSNDTCSTEKSDESKMVEYHSFPPLSGIKKISMKFRRKPLYVWARAWYEPLVNRILGVKAQSADSFDIEDLKEICDQYEIVQDTR